MIDGAFKNKRPVYQISEKLEKEIVYLCSNKVQESFDKEIRRLEMLIHEQQPLEIRKEDAEKLKIIENCNIMLDAQNSFVKMAKIYLSGLIIRIKDWLTNL